MALLRAHLDALTFVENSVRLPRWQIVAMLGMHGLGLAATFYLLAQPLWRAPILLAALLGVPFLTRRTLTIQTLSPLFFLYAIVAARFVFIRFLGGDVPGYFDYNAPDLRSTLFRLEPWLICTLVYTFTIQFYFFVPRLFQFLPAILVLLVFTWASALYIGQRTHGVTGSDPYAYTQMGIDLANRGAPLHRFTLFPSVAPLNLAWSPIVHTGYHIPVNTNGDAPTVWSPGGSLAYALAYRLLGEAGLYLVNPLFSLLLVVATGWLAFELFANSKLRAWIVALSIAMLATSHTLFDWATVTMVDAQAALFTVLAITLSLRFVRQSNLALPFLSGIALGVAYAVRHTQVLIAPAIFVLLWFNDLPRPWRLRALSVAGIGACLLALPDLWYHQAIFGGIFNVESTELNLFSLAAVPSTINALFADVFAAREFGWLIPFLCIGAYGLGREKRANFFACVLWVGVLLAFHLLYPALRPRDLLPEFPPLVSIMAYGAVTLIDWAWRAKGWRTLWSAGILIVTFFVWLMRVWNILPIPFGEPQRSFGYLTADQRAAFARIAELTPPRAVIGASLNSGAIDLYAHRETFLPAMWSPQEQDLFFAAMWREGRAIYLLDDSAAITALRPELESKYSLQKILALDVPMFGATSETTGALWQIKKIP